MKTNYNILSSVFTFAILLCFTIETQAQCSNDNIQYGTSSAPNAVGQITTLTTCIYGGEYRLITGLQAGSQYAFETCGDTDFDTQLSIYDAVTGAFIAYNDDYCGLQSRASFTSNGNNVRVLVDRYYCSSQSSCMTLKATRLTGNNAQNPCNLVATLTCGTPSNFTLASGNGSWNPPGPWGTPGREKVFEFTPTISGMHTISVTNNNYYVDLFIQSGSCSSSSWTYIDDIYTSANNSLSLTAGTTYYLLLDDENTTVSSGTISISCPSPASNPCNSISSLSCGVSENFNLGSGSGAWNPSGPWGTPGNEKVFSYTPTISQNYQINVTNTNYYVDLFYKSGSCGPTGWTYIDDIYTSATNSIYLTAGTTYYFLLDDENTTASSGTISIDCPCLPPANGIDVALNVNAPVTYSSTTSGACDDCSLRSSEDRVIQVNITCPGDYTFSLCGGATWDTYLYLTTAPCGGTILASNDDNCSLQSEITATISAGTYYLAIEGFSSNSGGTFTLDISKSCNMSVSVTATQFACGYNVSCNGLSDGSATAIVSNTCGNLSYLWNNGSTMSTASGLSAGAYSVIVTDDFGCSTTASTTLIEPTPVIADGGPDQTVYYGYTPMSCATMNAFTTGGCSQYNYFWTESNVSVGTTSSITVCPSTSSTYTLTVTDQNGCSATDEVGVCVIDVTCYAGNSNVPKVEMCHIPHGNPGNPQDICISPSAVPAHLNHGCTLGTCNEQNDCSANNRLTTSLAYSSEEKILENQRLEVFPNPFDDQFNIYLNELTFGIKSIELLDVFGRVILTKQATISASNNIINMSVGELPTGIYVIRVVDSENQENSLSALVVKN